MQDTGATALEMAQLAAGDVPRLKLKWAFAFPGDAAPLLNRR
jgi:hypothetical protein